MNKAIAYLIPFIKAIQKQSHTVEITLDRPNRSQTVGTLDTYVTEGSGGILRGLAGTFRYAGEPSTYVERIMIWLSPEDLYIELAPHESPLPIERFPIQGYLPLPYGLSIRGSGFTANLNFYPLRKPANSIPAACPGKASR